MNGPGYSADTPFAKAVARQLRTGREQTGKRAPGNGLKGKGRGIAVNRDSTDLPQTASACRASGAAFASTGATSSRRLDPEHRERVDLLSLATANFRTLTPARPLTGATA